MLEHAGHCSWIFICLHLNHITKGMWRRTTSLTCFIGKFRHLLLNEIRPYVTLFFHFPLSSKFSQLSSNLDALITFDYNANHSRQPSVCQSRWQIFVIALTFYVSWTSSRKKDGKKKIKKKGAYSIQLVFVRSTEFGRLLICHFDSGH